MRALVIRTNTEAAAKRIGKRRDEIAAITADAGLTDEGKAKRLGPLVQGIREEVAAVRELQHGLMSGAYAELERHRPAAEHRRAALKDPARAVALAQLADRLSDAELVGIATDAANPDAPDSVLAYALRHMASDRLNRMDETTRADLHRTLATVATTPATAKAVSDFIAARIEMDRFEQLADPAHGAATLTRAREARTVDLGDGPRTLSDDEIAAHYARLNLPVTPKAA
jgi:hypothetical protein